MTEAETCMETEGCRKWPPYPDSDGYLFCRDYDGDPNFPHVPEPRRTELQERYTND